MSRLLARSLLVTWVSDQYEETVSVMREVKDKFRAIVVARSMLETRQVTARLKNYPFVEVVGESWDANEGIEMILRCQPDLVLLDTDLPVFNGLQMTQTVRTCGADPHVILLSSGPEYAAEAYELGAVDYLIKMPSRVRFHAAMDKFLRFASLELDRAEPEDTGSFSRGLLVRDASQFRLLPYSDIHAVTASDKLTEIWTSKQSYLSDDSIDRLHAKLPESSYFRVHRGALCRLDSIDTVLTDGKGHYRVTLRHDVCPELTVSRRRYRPLLQSLAA